MNNLNESHTLSDKFSPIILNIPSYGFHLLSGSELEQNFTLLLDFEGEEAPSKREIENYLYRYTKGYALSRWFERIAIGFGVPGLITPLNENDWAGEKIISARGGNCPIYFVDSIEEFCEAGAFLEGKDALVVSVGDIDIRGKFFPFIDQVIDVMIQKKEEVFNKKELKRGDIGIHTMLTETPMVFAMKQGGTQGVTLHARKTKGCISYKIVDRMIASNKGKGIDGKTKQILSDAACRVSDTLSIAIK